jgi:LysM repeat protein
MITKRLRILVLLLLASIVLVAACTRSASTPPPTTSEETPSGQGDDTQATMDAFRSTILTQTAQVEDSPADDDPTPTPEVQSLTETVVSTDDSPAPTKTPPPGSQTEYTVKAGDWIWKIARSFGVDPQDIIDLNGLTSPSQISPGLVLKIPAQSSQPVETEEPISTPGAETPEPSGIVHVVKAGEWIWQIARIYNVDPQDIIDANDLIDPTLIYPGQELKIP